MSKTNRIFIWFKTPFNNHLILKKIWIYVGINIKIKINGLKKRKKNQS